MSKTRRTFPESLKREAVEQVLACRSSLTLTERQVTDALLTAGD
ncbi:hypothetical protein [Vogesella indigofera]|nr:hypothetical protein [Vogesella indigofera]MDC7700594.1 hypothetical protein [Vogesella indigofera]